MVTKRLESMRCARAAVRCLTSGSLLSRASLVTSTSTQPCLSVCYTGGRRDTATGGDEHTASASSPLLRRLATAGSAGLLPGARAVAGEGTRGGWRRSQARTKFSSEVPSELSLTPPTRAPGADGGHVVFVTKTGLRNKPKLNSRPSKLQSRESMRSPDSQQPRPGPRADATGCEHHRRLPAPEAASGAARQPARASPVIALSWEERRAGYGPQALIAGMSNANIIKRRAL
ncbi:hypothetical protein NDU88_006439 [Pleurodeles waltl]|uniref:Uncharacterized protein n=1 Tax=Pleurodeles waltl TaxID=8319 RepID=A0AAV7M072_PLEWA|nr:hypothetical protein NDU88_006439 [Pleurodeles waltl]